MDMAATLHPVSLQAALKRAEWIHRAKCWIVIDDHGINVELSNWDLIKDEIQIVSSEKSPHQSLAIKVLGHHKIHEPLYIIYALVELGNLKLTIEVEEAAHLSIIETHLEQGGDLASHHYETSILLSSHAKLQYYKCYPHVTPQQVSSRLNVIQKQQSELALFHWVHHYGNVNESLNIKLLEDHATFKWSGLSTALKNKETVHFDALIEHQAHHTESHIIYKSLLNDYARSHFKGRVHVNRDVSDAIAFQEKHYLLLSDRAIAISQPELKIDSQSVQCKHAATMGQLDESALFYLESRGISKQAAKQLLVYAFMETILSTLAYEPLKEWIAAEVNHHEH